MYSAPAVSYPVGRSHFHGQLLVGAIVLSGFSLAMWIMQSDVRAFRHLVVAALWLGSATVAIVAWLRSPHGVLTWDGRDWTWTCHDVSHPVVPSVMLDSQSALLVHWRVTGASNGWIWLERRTAPTRWLPLRRAVFAPLAANAVRDADDVLS
jgi:toxin CptA